MSLKERFIGNLELKNIQFEETLNCFSYDIEYNGTGAPKTTVHCFATKETFYDEAYLIDVALSGIKKINHEMEKYLESINESL